MKAKHYILAILLYAIGCNIAFAQEAVQIFGSVDSAGVSPIPGATIFLKSTKSSQKTDKNGHFLILLRHDTDTLVVSHIGYQTLSKVITPHTKYPLQLTLIPAINALHEVVVSTGYQDIPKERATGSFYKLDNQILNERVSPDIISRLDGITSGLLFDHHDVEQQTIQIHGLSTLNYGAASPLIVL